MKIQIGFGICNEPRDTGGICGYRFLLPADPDEITRCPLCRSLAINEESRLVAVDGTPLGVCKVLVTWYDALVKENEGEADDRTAWVGMSEFEALLQNEDDDLVNDPALVAIVTLARSLVEEALQ